MLKTICQTLPADVGVTIKKLEANAKAARVRRFEDFAKKLEAIAKGLAASQKKLAKGLKEGETVSTARALYAMPPANVGKEPISRSDARKFVIEAVGCGADITELLAEVPEDGSENIVTCPGCKTEKSVMRTAPAESEEEAA